MKARYLLRIASFLLIVSVIGPASAGDLQRQLKDNEVGKHWIYNDWPAAKAAAIKAQKPIFVLFR